MESWAPLGNDIPTRLHLVEFYMHFYDWFKSRWFKNRSL